MKRAASSSSGQTIPDFVFPSVRSSAAVAADVDRDEGRREVNDDIHRSERLAHGTDDRFGLTGIELDRGDFRAAEPIADGGGIGEFTGAEENAPYARLPGENRHAGSALRASADNQDVLVFLHERVIGPESSRIQETKPANPAQSPASFQIRVVFDGNGRCSEGRRNDMTAQSRKKGARRVSCS
jgi:hypothetical protein